ncbi:MAG: malate synthase A, partial [Alphaproteobacteria bacterium]|nr:malate synthase A [Alphaproteobacteria bacterium]
MFEDLETPAGHVRVTGPLTPAQAPLLTPEALSFLATLARRFTEPIEARLAARRARQARFDAGERPDFLPETRAVREGDWTCDPLPPA